MKVYIGADHRGVQFKEKIKKILGRHKVDVVDMGAFDETKSCDYPKVAYKVAKAVAKSKNGRGVLLCMSGIGQAMAANKVPGAYAALCYNVESAKLSRQHNNSNILVLGAKFVKPSSLPLLIKTWLTTEFEGGRHQRRLDQVKRIEKGLSL
jgi:RpiB/LacA/LacB family sugar-phosphate isomerase